MLCVLVHTNLHCDLSSRTMASYEHSTQRRVWTYSQTDLASLHSQRHAISVAFTTASAGPSTGEEPVLPARKRPRPDDSNDASSSSEPGKVAYVSLADEQRFLHWCALELLRMCREAGFDRAILSASLAFLHRFYVHTSMVHYPPQELLTPCIFLGIKAEACPYTEFEPLTRRLSRFDSDWRSRVHCLLTQQGVTSVEEQVTQSASASSEGGESFEEPQPWHLSLEAPLLHGLKYQLVTHAPYRVLKSILVLCIEDYAVLGMEGKEGGTGIGRSAVAIGNEPARERIVVQPSTEVDRAQGLLSVSDEAFAVAWDAIQARAFEYCDAALAAGLGLVYTPAHIACAALALSARSDAVFSSPPVSPPPGSQLTGSTQAHGEQKTILAAVATPPPVQVAWWVGPWLSEHLRRGPSPSFTSVAAMGSSSMVETPQATVQSCLTALVSFMRELQATWAAGPALLSRLEQVRDTTLVPGTPAHAAKTASLRSMRQAYKAAKEAKANAARKAYEEQVKGAKAALNIVQPVLGQGT